MIVRKPNLYFIVIFFKGIEIGSRSVTNGPRLRHHTISNDLTAQSKQNMGPTHFVGSARPNCLFIITVDDFGALLCDYSSCRQELSLLILIIINK